MNSWLHAMLSTPTAEYPEFPAALSFLPNLAPGDAAEARAARATRLEERLVALDAEIAEVGRFLPRLSAIESEYQRQLVRAELASVRDLVEDLRAQRITWPFEEEQVSGLTGPKDRRA